MGGDAQLPRHCACVAYSQAIELENGGEESGSFLLSLVYTPVNDDMLHFGQL